MADRIRRSVSFRDEDREMLIARLQAMLAKEEGILFAYLFGSAATRDSVRDVDVAIYLDPARYESESDRFFAGLSIAGRLERAIRPLPIDVVVLNEAPLPLRYEASRILLIARDQDAQVRFEVRTRDLYLDFLPRRRLFYRRLVLALE
jgi:predicted nucleotidyltransferase